VWTVLARQTGQDRKDPADQVEAGLLDRARHLARRRCTGWNWLGEALGSLLPPASCAPCLSRRPWRSR
jgi:hypothetical protein